MKIATLKLIAFLFNMRKLGRKIDFDLLSPPHYVMLSSANIVFDPKIIICRAGQPKRQTKTNKRESTTAHPIYNIPANEIPLL